MKETNSTSSSKETNDPVNSPSHYNMLNIEAINLIEMSMTEDDFLGYLKGNALKYITRHRRKGDGAKDIHKAIHYLEMILEVE